MHNGSPNIYFDFPIQCYTHLQNRFWSPRLSFIERIFNFVVNHRKYREHVKDLSCLSKDLRRIVIVDNNPFSFLLQPLNGIPCVPFSAEQPNDKQHLLTMFRLYFDLLLLYHMAFIALEVLLPLLKHLSLQKDVRPVLYERFHMPDWFQMHGIPASNLTI
ncbi:hypothetical protein CK203_039504 [Vitis vinifera]|uniref:Mitochondrial import inner membrane translocase subunit TIM50 n=1 Tax=Vitis vinifera TaxID=29760 RepID=A0A438HKG6_VITVI|nr:hypothetical protein CK203_039504 [Vitis vinifera]